jgi:hypothetical protein
MTMYIKYVSLPKAQADPLCDRHFIGLTIAEMASNYDLTDTTLRRRLAAAEERLGCLVNSEDTLR